MWRMAICATNIVAPVFAAAEVVVLFSARMAGKTSLRYCLGRFILERNDLRWITFFAVGLAWTVASLTTGYLSFPTTDGGELGMRGMRESFELVFVTVLAGIAADVTGVSGRCA